VIALLDPHLEEPISEAAQSITVVHAVQFRRLHQRCRSWSRGLAVSHFLPEQYTYRVTLRRSS